MDIRNFEYDQIKKYLAFNAKYIWKCSWETIVITNAFPFQ